MSSSSVLKEFSQGRAETNLVCDSLKEHAKHTLVIDPTHPRFWVPFKWLLETGASGHGRKGGVKKMNKLILREIYTSSWLGREEEELPTVMLTRNQRGMYYAAPWWKGGYIILTVGGAGQVLVSIRFSALLGFWFQVNEAVTGTSRGKKQDQLKAECGKACSYKIVV